MIAVAYRDRVIGYWLTDRLGLCRYVRAGGALMRSMSYEDRFGRNTALHAPPTICP